MVRYYLVIYQIAKVTQVQVDRSISPCDQIVTRLWVHTLIELYSCDEKNGSGGGI